MIVDDKSPLVLNVRSESGCIDRTTSNMENFVIIYNS